MRLLILTQAVDRNDPVLGFFHGWLREFSKNFELIEVVCLKVGSHTLPQNVRVHSLGKGKIASGFGLRAFRKIQYTLRFWRYAWSLRHEYDAVLVHMNQEYVLLGGTLWWLLRKPVYMWRNHYKGSLLTDIAAIFCKKVFCTSKFSYTAKYRKTVLMPVGVDTQAFKPLQVERAKNSILSLGRIAPSKQIDVFLRALSALKERTYSAAIYGEPFPKDIGYRDSLKRISSELHLNVRFHPGVPNEKTPEIYSAYDVFVNCSKSGMYDKTIFEAAACGCIVLASSRDFGELVGKYFEFLGEEADLTKRLEKLLSLRESEKDTLRATLISVAQKHSLAELGHRLVKEIA